MSLSTRSRSASRTNKQNYRLLAGLEEPGKKPRRTSAQATQDREEADTQRRSVADKQKAAARRIAEMEERIEAEDSTYIEEATARPEVRAVRDESEDDLPLKKTAAPRKPKKLGRADIIAERQLQQSPCANRGTSGAPARRAVGKENIPPGTQVAVPAAPAASAATAPARRAGAGKRKDTAVATGPQKKVKPAHPSGVQPGWAPGEERKRGGMASQMAKSGGTASAGIVLQQGDSRLEDSDGEGVQEERAALTHTHTTSRGRSKNHVSISRPSQLPPPPPPAPVRSRSPDFGILTAEDITIGLRNRRTNGSRKFTNDDLPIPRNMLWRWRNHLIPRFLEILGDSSANPWNFVGMDLVSILQALWDEFFPDIPWTVMLHEPVYEVAMNRLRDWRHKIGEAGLVAVTHFINEATNDGVFNAPIDVASYVHWALGSGMPFRYASSTHAGADSRIVLVEDEHWGAFQSDFILRVLGTHFACVNRSDDSYEQPHCALSLCVTAVERALARFERGQVDEEPAGKFSQETYGKITTAHLNAVGDLREATWEKILKGAQHWKKASWLLPGDFSDPEWLEPLDGDRGIIDDVSEPEIEV